MKGFRDALPGFPQPAVLVDGTGAIQDCNAAFCELVGVECGAAPLMAVSELLGPDSDELMKAVLVCRPWRGRLRMRSGDRPEREVDACVAVLSPGEADGNALLLLTFADMTAEVWAYRTLKAEYDRLDFAVKGSSDGLWEALNVNPSSEKPEWKVDFSDRAKEILGYTADSYPNMLEQWFRLLHPDDVARTREAIRRHLYQRAPYDIEYRLKVKGGEYRWFNARGVSVWSEGGVPVRMAGSLRDIHEQKLLEEELRHAKDSLEHRVAQRTEELQQANAELHANVAERQRREQVLTVLMEIAEAVGEAPTLADLCRRIYECLRKLIDAPNFYVAILQPDGSLYFPYEEDPERDVTLDPETAGRSFTMLVIRSGKIQLYQHRDMLGLIESGAVARIGTPAKSWMGVPLQANGATFGALVVQDYVRDHHFTDDDVALMKFASRQISQAIARKQALDALSKSERELSMHFQQTPLAVIVASPDKTILRWNPAAEELFGYTAAEAIGRNGDELLLPAEEMPGVSRVWSELLSGKGGERGSNRNRTKDGRIIYAEWYNTTLVDADGKMVAIASQALNVTDRVMAERALRISEERYALAVLGANDGIWDWNLETGEVYFSPRWKAQLGFQDEQISSDPDEWFRRVHPDDQAALRAALDDHLNGRTSYFQNEHRILASDGTWLWALSRGLAVRDMAGKATRIAGSQSDVTARRRAEERIVHAATHDALTGVPNRSLFLDRLGRTMARCVRHPDHSFAVLFLDLDRFKIINDSLGHRAGDALLIAIAQRLQAMVRPEDTVGRLGGDEFTILLEEVHSLADATHIAERILQEFHRPFDIGGQEVTITASIGLVLGGAKYETAEDLMRDADRAMYAAKARGKDALLIFDDRLHQETRYLVQLETSLRHALEREEFFLQFQPVVDLSTQRTAGFEAFLRWRHPERGVMAPKEFLHIAEDMGLMLPLGLWIVREACRQLERWGAPRFCYINVSPLQLLQREFVDQVESLAAIHGLERGQLRFEVGERGLAAHLDSVEQQILALRKLGVRIYIDEFEAGLGSLGLLRRQVFDGLKIGRRLLDPSGTDVSLDESLLMMIRRRGLEAIGCGIEERRMLDRARSLGLDLGQGFLFAAPMDADHAMARVAREGAQPKA